MNFFDEIRIKHGAENLYSAFHEHYQHNPRLAISWLNSPSLTFQSLYFLIPYLSSIPIPKSLNARNKYALFFANRQHSKSPQSLEISTLYWIFTTGALDDGLSSDFDELLDIACQKLLVTHSKTTIIPTAIELMFNRNRKCGHIHDLAWCICRTGHTETMELISEYLRSDLEADNLLAYRLLNFKPELQEGDKNSHYKNFHSWLSDNKAFIYPAHQSFNESTNPKAWRVDLPSKYLCTPLNKPMSQKQKNIAEEFIKLPESDQKLLAKQSFKLHHNDVFAWNNFMNTAQNFSGGAYYI